MIITWQQWLALSPILVSAATCVAVMLAIAIRRHHWGNATVFVAGINGALAASSVLFFGPLFYPDWIPLVLPQQVTPLLVVDMYSVFYTGLILTATLATATLMNAYIEGFPRNKEEIYLLLSLSALGAMLLVHSNHFATLFLGLELMSLPLYGLVAYRPRHRKSLEAGVKYLVLSALASALLLFGIALIYAHTGTLSFIDIGARLDSGADHANVYLLVGGALIVAGLGFKLSLVPFHLWTPDVYEGAPAPVTGFLATVSKTAVFVVLLRYVMQAGAHHHHALMDALSVLAVLSIVIGNLLALMQSNVKRMLGYSSIAQVGYGLVALIAAREFAVEAVGVFLLTYVITSICAFGVVTLMSSPMRPGERDADSYYDYRGLFWRRHYLSSILTVSMLSLAGIPLTAGFIGKFYVMAAGVDAKLWILLGAVVFGSAVGLYYYLRLMITLFLPDPEGRQFNAPLNWGQQTGGYMAIAFMLLMLAIGVFPGPVLQLVQIAGF
jgi:NADH-quinone oxidoreductase subunit N